MCGIVGYVGHKNAVERVIKGLSILEYRGYDSSGLAALYGDKIEIVKCKGRVGALLDLLLQRDIQSSHCSIGHTRWATHGGPSDINAHPHRYGKTVIVHNGIIENYKEIQSEINAATISETDTEVAAALIDSVYSKINDPIEAIMKSTRFFNGAYALGIMFDDIESKIYAVRNKSPLIIAKEKDGFYIASDITAVLDFTNEYFYLSEGDVACLDTDNVEVFSDKGEKTEIIWRKTEMSVESTQKNGFSHFMLKEIHEEPDAIVKSLSGRIKNGLPNYSSDNISEELFKSIEKIHIVACGSAVYAGVAGGKLIERMSGVPVFAYVASEYRYDPPLIDKNTLVIVISQSGETADTLAALRYAKDQGITTLAIVNAPQSTIAREADMRIYTHAGPEIAVATTKGYCTQLSELCLLSIAIGCSRGLISSKKAKKMVLELFEDAPKGVNEILEKADEIKLIAKKIYNKEHIFYIGRGLDYALALEGALKLKEISYIHAEAYAAGELKHGTISLIEKDTPVIAISTSNELFDKTESNVKEVKSRGAFVIELCKDNVENSKLSADEVIKLPSSSFAATVFSAMTALQLLAYETASLRGCDIDKPRNLAKSVTVE